MAVRSKKLFQGQMAAANAWTTVYTVSALETTIIKQICATDTDNTNSARLDLGINGTNASQRLLHIPLAAGGSVDKLTFIVLQPGDTIRARAQNTSAPTAVALYLGGAELEGVAD